MNSNRLAALSLGGLLYCRAENAERLLKSEKEALTALALYLGDELSESETKEEEQAVRRVLQQLRENAPARCPMLFIRVRDAKQLTRVHKLLGSEEELLMGYVMPRFSPDSAEEYLDALEKINSKRKHPLYAMPVLETEDIANLLTRKKALEKIRKRLGANKDSVLCVYAGARAFCALYGLDPAQTGAYPEAVRNILTDIISVFSPDFTVAGGEWDSGDGMREILAWERENGLCGGTVACEDLLELYFDSMKATQKEADAAKAESRGTEDGGRIPLPGKARWAEDILTRASVFGIRE